MTEFAIITAIVVLVASNILTFVEQRKMLNHVMKTNQDLTDRLLAKTPEQYFGVRIEEAQLKAVSNASSTPEDVNPLQYSVGPRP